jgi:endonuclease YncB( thermonuclease family)
MDYLERIIYNDTVPFVPPITHGKVVKVYDGDTLTLAAKLPYEASPVYRFQVRFSGIDCPELRSKNSNEKSVALLAKDFISSRVLNRIVELQNVEMEKYGRILARVYYDGICLNDQLVAENLAVEYDGGTKHCPDDWVHYHENKK